MNFRDILQKNNVTAKEFFEKMENGTKHVSDFGIHINSLQERDKAPKNVRDRMPEGTLYFKGVASNGDLNRN